MLGENDIHNIFTLSSTAFWPYKFSIDTFLFIAPVSCGNPPNGIKTESVPEDLTLNYLDVWNYTCLPGYETCDEMSTYCQLNGSFSLKQPPNCTGMFVT